MNTIGTVKFDFLMRNQNFARELYGRWDQFFAQTFEQVTDSILSKYDNKSEIIEIESLNLDLGVLYESNFDSDFIDVLREKMEEALLQCLFNPQIEGSANKISKSVYAFEALKHFLLHGSLLNGTNEYGNIDKLFAKVIKENSKELKQFLQTYGHYTSLQQRLVYQLDNMQLESGVRLLESASATFICSYVKLLHNKYEKISQPTINKSNYTHTVWLVVYAYLLTNRSSFSDKKTFVAQTILQLAANYNLPYNKLIEIVTFDLNNYVYKTSIPIELFTILAQLKNESDEQQLKQLYSNAAKFYQSICGLIQTKLATTISRNGRDALINILSKTESCRLFIQHLSENEIKNLLPVVSPNNADFVIETARILDEQKTQGALQGKAGGEFRLLKWQILLPILLQNTSSLNRGYFVESVFKSVASHYNSSIFELLNFILNDKSTLEWIDNKLLSIIHQLYKKNKSTKVEQPSNLNNNDIAYIVKAVRGEQVVSDSYIRHIIKQLGNDEYCKRLIKLISENDRYKLVKLLYTKQGDLIVDYVHSLDLLQSKGALEGGASGEFKTIKWQFIVTVLSGMPQSIFNAKIFVNKSLLKLSAHYNISYFDLLVYFQADNISIHLPHQLHSIINQLYYDEQSYWVNVALQSTVEADKHKLISLLFPTQLGFVKAYKKVLDQHYKHTTALQHIAFNSFKTITWRFIFAVLCDMRNQVFNKKQFIVSTLSKLSAHYQISLITLIKYFTVEGLLPKTTHFTEINTIIGELYNELAVRHRKSKLNKKTDYTILQLKRNFTENAGVLNKSEQVLFNKLFNNEQFVNYIKGVIGLLPQIRGYFGTELKTSLTNADLICFLNQLATNYKALSVTQILQRLVNCLCDKLTTDQQARFEIVLGQWGATNTLIAAIYKPQNKQRQITEKEIINQPEIADTITHTPLYINNGGMVLLCPYFPQLFSMLNLTSDNKFIDTDTQVKAIYLMQYAVFGHIDCAEHELTLNKLLTGFKTGKPIPRNSELTTEETDTVNSMLQGVIKNWSKLKSTSVEGLREGFLQRDAKLEDTDDIYTLTVEEKAYDMLLDSVPWSFKTVKYSWMDKPIQVKWR